MDIFHIFMLLCATSDTIITVDVPIIRYYCENLLGENLVKKLNVPLGACDSPGVRWSRRGRRYAFQCLAAFCCSMFDLSSIHQASLALLIFWFVAVTFADPDAGWFSEILGALLALFIVPGLFYSAPCVTVWCCWSPKFSTGKGHIDRDQVLRGNVNNAYAFRFPWQVQSSYFV